MRRNLNETTAAKVNQGQAKRAALRITRRAPPMSYLSFMISWPSTGAWNKSGTPKRLNFTKGWHSGYSKKTSNRCWTGCRTMERFSSGKTLVLGGILPKLGPIKSHTRLSRGSCKTLTPTLKSFWLPPPSWLRY